MYTTFELLIIIIKEVYLFKMIITVTRCLYLIEFLLSTLYSRRYFIADFQANCVVSIWLEMCNLL